MKRINASKFKEQCLSLLESLDPEGLEITKHGRPIARLVPVESSCAHLIGSLKGQILVDPDDDLFSTGIEWDAQS